MAKKKVLIVESNTEKSNKANLATRSTDPDMLFDFKQFPISEGRVNQIIDALETWLDKNPEAKSICEFYHEQKMPRSTYEKLCKRHSRLGELHDHTMDRLGHRLWSRSVDFKANWNPVKFMLHAYSPEYAAAKEFDAMLAAKAREHVDASNGPQIVVIEKFADSPIVPEKK